MLAVNEQGMPPDFARSARFALTPRCPQTAVAFASVDNFCGLYAHYFSEWVDSHADRKCRLRTPAAPRTAAAVVEAEYLRCSNSSHATTDSP